MTTRTPEPRTSAAITSKITPRHLDRLAIVYVRQSTMQQVLHNQESTRGQYNLVDRAITLGWPRERVLVIDDDLGRSGASAEGRPGFQRLVAEVGLNHVGLILGVEMSRFARSSSDWHQLLEVCSIFGTLLSDLDGVYDPAHFNDRMLLGLKGTISEAELHMLRQRMNAGRLIKAERGELRMNVATGYVRRPSGEVVKDPDDHARTVVETIFERFEVQGTLHSVLRYLVEHDLKMPVRSRTGLDKGDLRWSRPSFETVRNILRNPIYAGAYVWGRRPTDPRAKKSGHPRTGRKVAHLGEWSVCLRDRVPAYISWERYESNLKQLERNAPSSVGVPREGAALLSGLVRCGLCGNRMGPIYSGTPRYSCLAEWNQYASVRCQSLTAPSLDAAVEGLLLRALEPASIEVSLAVAADIDAERARGEKLWQQRLERAQYDVDRSRRQYNAVEPENRLVARSVERQLEEHLATQIKLQEDHRRERAESPVTLTEQERAAIRRLASDIPALWHATTTTMEQKKTLVRQLIHDVSVTLDGKSERATMTVTWVGGHRTEAAFTRPVAKVSRLSYGAELLARALTLQREGRTHAQIAEVLNAEGWRSAKQCKMFKKTTVAGLLTLQRLATTADTPPAAIVAQRSEHEWTLPALAHALGMHSGTLHHWVRKGWVKARKVPSPNPVGMWLLWADDGELVRLHALRNAPRTR